MIEAVNTAIANASLVRASAGQVDAARSFAANPSRVQEVAQLPQAPFLSLSIGIDNNYDEAVIRFRDTQTGDVLSQIPSEGRLEARQREQTAANIVFQQTAREVEQHTDVVAQSSVPVSTASYQQATTTYTASNVTAAPAQAAQASLSTGGVSVLA